MTKNQKWDWVGFSVSNKKLTPVLIEFSGGIDFNNTYVKENDDMNKLASACINSIDYVTATTDLTVPVPEFAVRFFGIYILLVDFFFLVCTNFDVTFVDAQIYFESIIKLSEDVYVKRTYTVIPVPTRPALLQKFLSKTAQMYQWRNAVVNLIKVVEEKNTYLKN